MWNIVLRKINEMKLSREKAEITAYKHIKKKGFFIKGV
jgi:hypothetical protein